MSRCFARPLPDWTFRSEPVRSSCFFQVVFLSIVISVGDLLVRPHPEVPWCGDTVRPQGFTTGTRVPRGHSGRTTPQQPRNTSLRSSSQSLLLYNERILKTVFWMPSSHRREFNFLVRDDYHTNLGCVCVRFFVSMALGGQGLREWSPRGEARRKQRNTYTWRGKEKQKIEKEKYYKLL